MADRMLLVTWGMPVRGREERALEIFNEAVGLAGRMQQDGRIESFDVVLLEPADIGGFMQLRGSAAQIAALSEDEEFMRNTMDAQMICDDVRHVRGVCNEGVAQWMQMYQEATRKVPQSA